MDVSIIIVNYNTLQLTKKCIESIFDHTKDISFEIILVDNASTDGSVEFLKNDDRIKFIQSHENLGFGRANNLGVKHAKGKYLFLLNSDCLLLNNSVKIFYDYFESYKNDDLGALGSYLLNPTGEIIHSYGYFSTLKYNILLALDVYLKRVNFNLLSIQEKFDYVDKKVDYITGADLFLTRSLFEELNGFDELFFMYYEESDLQYRMSLLSKIRLIISGPRIIHLCGASSGISNKSMRRNLMSTRSLFKYLKKHNSLFIFCLFRVLYFLLRLPPILFVRSYTFKEKKDYLKLLLKCNI